MKRISLSLMVLLLTLVACAPQISTPIPSPIPSPIPQAALLTATPSISIPGNLTPAQGAALALSQTLSLPPEKISLVSFETVTWPNDCMGVQQKGVACKQVSVPGFWILLSANAKQYEFHTNQDGTKIVPADGVPTTGQIPNAAIKQLAANLGLQVSDISVTSAAGVIWNDTCLNVPLNGVACTPKNGSGYLFMLQANGRQYEYHTNGSGGHPVPGTLGLIWTRSSGGVEACDTLNIYASGEVYGFACKPKPVSRTDTLIKLATPAGLKQLQSWLDTNQTIALDSSNPTTTPTDTTIAGHLFGTGSQVLTADQQQAILVWEQSVYQELYK